MEEVDWYQPKQKDFFELLLTENVEDGEEKRM